MLRGACLCAPLSSVFDGELCHKASFTLPSVTHVHVTTFNGKSIVSLIQNSLDRGSLHRFL